MKVDCVYRVAPMCGIMKGTFDTDTGRLVTYPDLFEVPVKDTYKYYPDNYTNCEAMPVRDLFNIMCRYMNALMAINYNNIGAIIVYPDKTQMYLKATDAPGVFTPLEYRANKYESRVIGVQRMPMVTPEVFQPLMYLASTYIKGRECIVTAKGIKQLHESCDEVAGSPSMERYADMCFDNEVIGTCSIMGKQKLLKVYGTWVGSKEE